MGTSPLDAPIQDGTTSGEWDTSQGLASAVGGQDMHALQFTGAEVQPAPSGSAVALEQGGGGSGTWASHPSAIGYRRQGYVTGGSHGGSGSGTITRREVERFVPSRRRRAANCAREAATLSERERVDGSLQTDAGNGRAYNGIGCPQPRMGRYRTARRVNAGNGNHVIASVFFEPWEGDTEPTMIGPIAPDKDADLLTTKETKYTKEIKILESKHTIIVYRAGRTRGIDRPTEFSPHH